MTRTSTYPRRWPLYALIVSIAIPTIFIPGMSIQRHRRLARATRASNLTEARALIQSSRSIDRIVDRFFESPLVIAMDRGDKAIFEGLLMAGANPDRVQNNKLPIQHAATVDDAWFTKKLLEFGANPNAVNEDARGHQRSPPIFWAIYFGSFDHVVALVNGGASVHARNHIDESTVTAAISDSKFLTAKYLIGEGADPFSQRKDAERFVNLFRDGIPSFRGPLAREDYESYKEFRVQLAAEGKVDPKELLNIERVTELNPQVATDDPPDDSKATGRVFNSR